MAKLDMINPFHRFKYQYSWYNVQGESQYKRLRKRWFYALYGDSGPHIGRVIPAANLLPHDDDEEDPVHHEELGDITLAKTVGWLRIPLFSINFSFRSFYHQTPEDDQSRIAAPFRPHLGLLDWDPITLLTMGRCRLANSLITKMKQLEKEDPEFAGSMAAGGYGLLWAAQAIVFFPLSIVSTIYSLIASPVKALLAGVLSRVLALVTLPFLSEDTSLPVVLPQDEPHPETLDQLRKERREATREISKNAAMLSILSKKAGNGNVPKYLALPSDIVAKVAELTAEMPEDDGPTPIEVAYESLGRLRGY